MLLAIPDIELADAQINALNSLYAYLDYSSLNRENEPRVLAAFYNGKKFEVTETVAEDLGDFILGLVQEQVE